MAHGLVLKLEEMLQRNLVCRKDPCEVLSEEDKIIKSWSVTSHFKFFKLDFYRLLRRTLLCVLSPQSIKELKKKELLKAMGTYFNACGKDLRSKFDILNIGQHLTKVILDPWQNLYFSWDEFFQEKISIYDQKVQEYFAHEPEDIVMARVHAFVIQGKEEMAMTLAKCSYMYHSRIAKTLFAADPFGHKVKPEYVLLGTKYKKGVASIDWYLFILQRKKLLPAIIDEMKQLTCHEGVQLIQRLRRSKKNQSFILTMLQILMMQELLQPSKFCCTKKIFSLWCLMHKEKKSGAFEINHAIRKMLAVHAPSSAHFYLFADSLWEQFGVSLITLYVELYVRGLTVDLNHLEAAKHREDREDINSLECHIALMFSKLSTLFSDFHEGAARECMFSAFSLKPTKERLYILQSLTHSILSTENEIKLSYSMNVKVSSQECKCDVRCDGHCQGNKEFCLEHPILKKGISNVPYLLVKDLVCVLEGVRCFQFQYNIFDWHNNATDLGDYLKDYNLMKSWESDTEYASEGSSRSDLDDSPEKPSCPVSQMNERPFHLSVKRKSEPNVARELFSLDVGANIEVKNDKSRKKIKLLEHNVSNEINMPEVFNRNVNSVQNFASSVGMEDAIENVIRMTLDKKQKPDILMNNNNFMNTSLDHDHDGIKNISLTTVGKHVSSNHVYPYSLTSLGKGKHLNSNYNSPECSEKSSPETTREYMPSFLSKSSNVYETTPHVSRESVISPVSTTKNFKPIQEQSCKPAPNKPFSVTTEGMSSYSCNKDSIPTNAHAGQKMSSNALKKVSMYQQLPYNLGSNKQISVYYSNAQGSVVSGKETGKQVLHLANVSTAHDYSKSHVLMNTPISSSSPSNVQSKDTSMQHSVYPSTSHSMSHPSLYRSDSRYQWADHSSGDNTIVKQIDQNLSCYEDNLLVHCDRSSVIHHTMHHVRENSVQERDELVIPTRLAVSVNSDAAEQIRCASNNDVTNLQPFTVNVSDRSISSSSVAISASLVINRKSQHSIDHQVSASQPVSNDPVTTSETITIPGILASPSVIVTPWETQIKSHGEMMYKKSANVINAYGVDKKIYRNRLPYMKQIILKPEQKIAGQIISVDKANLQQVFKTVPSTNHLNPLGSPPSIKQSQPNSVQNWQVMKKSTPQGVSKPTSSQPSNNQNWQVVNKSTSHVTSTPPTSGQHTSVQNWQVVSKSTPQVAVKPSLNQASSIQNRQVVSKSTPQVVAKSTSNQASNIQKRQVGSKLTSQVASKQTSNQASNVQNWQVATKSTSQGISVPILSQPSSIQNWQSVKKSTSLVVSKPASSQPWYSEPYPKHSVSESSTASKPNASLNAVRQNTSSNIKLQTKQIPNRESFTVFAKEVPSNISTSSALVHGNNPIPDSSVKLNHFNKVSQSPNLTVHTSAKEALLHKDCIASSSSSQLANIKNTKFSTAQCNILKKHSAKSPNQFADSTTNTILVQEKNFDAFTASNVVDSNRHYCHTSSENFPNMCCSPTEVNPCQTCSLPPTEISSAQASSQKSSNCPPDQQQPTPNQKKMVAENTSVTSAFHSLSESRDDGDATRIMLSDSDIGETLTTCQYCSQCFAAKDLDVHILNCHQKDENYDTVIGSNEMLPENICTLKALPDVVPVQDTLFHIDSFPNNLPHSKSFMSSSENQQGNVIDVKNFEDIEANAFTACMDLINSDKDLKRIVQGIESLDQIENNFLPFMPSADTPNLLNTDIDTEIQKNDVPAVPNQNLAISDKDQFNTSAMQPDDPQFTSGRIHSVNSRGNVFEFTEKDYEASKPAQKLIHSKPQTSFTEKISPNSSKATNEGVTFSTIAEMIKATISDGNDELEPFETFSKVISKEKPQETAIPHKNELEFWICQFCSKKLRSASTLKRHILKLHPNQNADSQADLPQKFSSVSPDLAGNYPQSANDLSVNSSHVESSSSVTPMTVKSIKSPNTSEMGILPKGRIKGIIKSPTTECKICGKILTAPYMKKHISKQHSGQQSEISIKTENSSSDLYDATVSSSSQVETSNFPAVSTVTEQDIDSSTCLSVSDALKRNGSYTIADASNLSNGSDKVSESTNVKFNFNDLEFSRDTHADGKASTSEEDQNLFPKLETFSENVKSEENSVKPNVVYTKGGFVLRNHFCSECPKAYTSARTLKSHMKSIHNLDLPKAPRKSKKLTTNSSTMCEAKPNIQPANIPENKEKDLQCPKEGKPSTSKMTPVLSTYLVHKPVVKFKKPLPNANSSMLKSVLQKSVLFKSKQLELKDSTAMKENGSFENPGNTNPVVQTLDEQKIQGEQIINSNLSLVAPENEHNICQEQLKDDFCSPLSLQISENEQNMCTEQLSCNFNSDIPMQTSENNQKVCNQELSRILNEHLPVQISENEQVCSQQINDNMISNPIGISENEQVCSQQINDNMISNPIGISENEQVCSQQINDNMISNPIGISENEQVCSQQINDSMISNPIQISENEQVCSQQINDNMISNPMQISENEQVCSQQINDNIISNPVQISENEQKCNEQLNLNKNSESVPLDVPLNSDFESGCNFSDSVPSENLVTPETESVQAISNFLVPDAVASNIPSETERLDYFQLNTVLPETDIVLQTEHFNPLNSECNVDCDSSSVQSNEISPVSKIISNVSKYQFGGTSNVEDRKELLDDNSLKLIIPKNQRESVYPESVNLQDSTIPVQGLTQKESNNDVFSNSDVPCDFSDGCLSNTNKNINAVETKESFIEDIVCEKRTSPRSEIKCRICHRSLSSINSLTKHLKKIHDIPVLKKRISRPSPVKLSLCVQESEKRSPPKLKLGPNESDSESVSDFDNPPTYLKTDSEQLEMASLTHKVLDNSCITKLPLSKQYVKKKENILHASGHFESLVQVEHTETEMRQNQLDPLHFVISDTEYQRKQVTVTSPCKYKFRRHSFCDTKSFFLQVKNSKSLSTAEINHLVSNIDFKNNCEIIKMKSVSLPNFQVTLKHVTTSRIEHDMNKTDTSVKSVDFEPDEKSDHPVKQTEVAVERSSDENKSFSSVHVTEVSKTSCDTSSESYPVKLNAVAINSDFVLPNPLLNSTSQLPPTQPTKSKISHNKLLLQKIKSYKKQNRMKRVSSKCFSYHKAFKPIVLTFKETTEVSEFLKTHKQPTVKLMRLKVDSSKYSKPLIKQIPPICVKYPMKEAVVKLERLKIPKDFGNLFSVKKKRLSSVLSAKTRFNSLTMQNAKNQSINFPNGFYLRPSSVDISNSVVSSTHANPPLEIDLTNSDSDITSSDAHQSVEALAMEVKCPVQTEGCSVPLPKKCFVVLKRISV